jgi:hypothetical protein
VNSGGVLQLTVGIEEFRWRLLKKERCVGDVNAGHRSYIARRLLWIIDCRHFEDGVTVTSRVARYKSQSGYLNFSFYEPSRNCRDTVVTSAYVVQNP